MLQKADSRFSPAFVCQRPTGVVPAVEYKGADRCASAEQDRTIGGLWADLSGARCRFVMAKEQSWGWIDPLLS